MPGLGLLSLGIRASSETAHSWWRAPSRGISGNDSLRWAKGSPKARRPSEVSIPQLLGPQHKPCLRVGWLAGRLWDLEQSGPGNDLGCVTNRRNLGNFSKQQFSPTSKKNNTVRCLGRLSPLMCSSRGSPGSWNLRAWAVKPGRALSKRMSENRDK